MGQYWGEAVCGQLPLFDLSCPFRNAIRPHKHDFFGRLKIFYSLLFDNTHKQHFPSVHQSSPVASIFEVYFDRGCANTYKDIQTIINFNRVAMAPKPKQGEFLGYVPGEGTRHGGKFMVRAIAS